MTNGYRGLVPLAGYEEESIIADSQDCIYYTKSGRCNHIDRGRGLFFLGKSCVLDHEFSSSCRKQIQFFRPDI